MKSSFNTHLEWIIPLALLLLIAPWSSALDLTLSGHFFNKESLTFSSNPLFIFLFDWGLLPAQLLWIGSLLVFLLAFRCSALKRLQKPALVIVLTIALGAGAITSIFKEGWKRPRPRQIEQFAGDVPFKPFYEPNFSATGSFKSFPSGHCAMGFAFFALAVIGRRIHRKGLFLAGFFFACLFGFSLALSRIAMGGHFFSDTLAAGCLMWITAVASDRFVYQFLQNHLQARDQNLPTS